MSCTSNHLKIVLTTAPSQESANHLAEALLNARLCACVNVIPSVLSKYWWEGKLQSEAELLLVIKTTAGALPELEALLAAKHPYAVPEFLVLSVESATTGYAAWVQSTLIGGNAQ